jgi:hypothetical protein
LLDRLARASELPDAAFLFVEPKHFEAPSLTPELRRHADHLLELRERLFAA